jgi:two-component system response regulator QseB
LKATILVVEDDLRLAKLLQQELSHDGHRVEVVHNGTDALVRADERPFDLVVLDLNLPDMDGVEVAERLRDRNAQPSASVLMLTARGDVKSRVEGLYAGASDYMTKPFSVQELLARVHVRLRERARPAEVIRHGDLVLEPGAGHCAVAGQPLALTSLEFRLLELFLTHKGRIFSKEDVEDRLYGADRLPGSNTIEVFVSNLRKKLAAAGMNGMIQTVRGMGYVVR